MTYEEFVEMRDNLGLSNNQVARISGVSTATLSQWKKGVYEPKPNTLAKIQNALSNRDDKAVDYVLKTNAGDVVLETSHIRPIPHKYYLDVFSIALPVPVELSDNEFTELRKATEVFAESWLKGHKKL